ncbi:MAG: toll/interleukin-1 receptor domain-containing protein, partial [Rhodothermia bacterium]
MKDVFISYAREDSNTAGKLSDALELEGLSVWWDREIPPGKTFDEVITEQLAQSKCVIVLWSNASVSSNWVLDEVSEARSQNKLVPVLIDDVQIPMGFR